MPSEIKETKLCEKPAAFRRYWPGKEPDLVCKEHADDSRAIMEALGLKLALEPLQGNDWFDDCACTPGRVQRVSIG